MPAPERPQRQHLIQSAGYWFNAARDKASEGLANEALMAMENAYNHVENALAAARAEVARLTEQLSPHKHGKLDDDK